jgi:hypothetical protein
MATHKHGIDCIERHGDYLYCKVKNQQLTYQMSPRGAVYKPKRHTGGDPIAEATAAGGQVIDNRGSKKPPFGYVWAEDKFMGGWGKASGKSYYALTAANPSESKILLANFLSRPEMRGIQFQIRTLPKLKAGDVLTVADKSLAARWYTSNAFRS